MKRTIALALLLMAATGCKQGQPSGERAANTKPPTLQNRETFLKARDQLAAQLLPVGDSVTIKVYVLIDETGRVHQPEVKQQLDQKLIDAAVSLVRQMHFNPATTDGKPQKVLLTVPVKLRNDGNQERR